MTTELFSYVLSTCTEIEPPIIPPLPDHIKSDGLELFQITGITPLLTAKTC